MKRIKCGLFHTVCVDGGGSLWVCGRNEAGQIGEGITLSSFAMIPVLREITSVACGTMHTACADHEGNVWVLGCNTSGQLGLPNTTHNGPVPTKNPHLTKIVNIAAGNTFTVCVDSFGNVYSFGSNNSGQLGTNDTVNKCIPTKLKPPLNNIQSVHCGCQFTILLDINGDIWSCGDNNTGQLGLKDTKDRSTFEKVPGIENITSVSCGINFVVCLDVENRVWGFGSNEKGQLALDMECFSELPRLLQFPKAIMIAAGNRHTLVVTEIGDLYACGGNDMGQLGCGDTEDRNSLVKVEGIANVHYLSEGGNHTLVKDMNESIFVFGSNLFGQLGIGTTGTFILEPLQLSHLSHIVDSPMNWKKSANK